MSWIRTTVIRTAAAAALLMIVAPPAAPAQECGNWTVTRAQPFSDMEAVAWGNGRFAGVGVGTATSFDGFAWVVPPTSGMAAGWAAADYRDVAFAGGRFVAVGATAVSGAWTGDILWSNDGVNWQRAVIPAVDIVRIVAYGNARWIAAATGTILWSDDGAAWQQAAVTGTIGGAGIEAGETTVTSPLTPSSTTTTEGRIRIASGRPSGSGLTFGSRSTSRIMS